jgi:arsenite oxidase small subunit
VDDRGDPKEPEEKESRRDFLKVAATISAALAIGGVASILKSIDIPAVPAGTKSAFPRVKVANMRELSIGKVVIFNYPLDNTPNVLAKLGQKGEDGVGPAGDVVAFSQVCQHLGCIWEYVPANASPRVNPSFKATSPVAYCPCHASVFDLTQAARVVSGPSPRPQPQVQLEVDPVGDIFAIGMGPPSIFGHQTGSTDVTNDLLGGTPIPST